MPTEPEKRDIVTEARELLETHSIVALSDDREPGADITNFVRQLCDEVERLRSLVRNMNFPRGD